MGPSVRNPIEPDRVALSHPLFPNGIEFKLVTEDGMPFIYLFAKVLNRNDGTPIQVCHRAPFYPPKHGDTWTKMNLTYAITNAFKEFIAHEVAELLTLDGQQINEPHQEPGDEDPSMWHPIKKASDGP